MERATVLVVGETPSLGRSVTDILDAAELPARFVADLDGEAPLETLVARHPVLVVASNSYFCSSARRWVRGEMPHVALVVVGSRDPVVAANANIRAVALPIAPSPFLTMIRQLTDLGEVGRDSTDGARQP
jgi:hypothetical protein